MNWPSLSILIPSYNQGRYIERTLLSIIHQNYPGELQTIVADGSSQDGTVEVLKKHPEITWWSRPDRGFADAVNQALAVSKGEVIAIQSSDDFYLHGAFETALPVFSERPDLGLVTGAGVVVQDGVPPVLHPLKAKSLRNPEDLLVYRGINQHCTFVRREAIYKVDGLRESVDQCADFDLWYRILHFYQGIILPVHLAAYQIHPTQRTQNKAQLWIDSFDSVIESCKTDPKYALAFTLSETVDKEFRKAMELAWYKTAGGEAGLETSYRLARDIIKDGDSWSENLRHQARALVAAHEREHSWLARLRYKAQIRTRLRQIIAHSPKGSHDAQNQTAPDVDVDWWQKYKSEK